ETFESLKTNKRKNVDTKLKTCIDCHIQMSANKKLKKNEQQKESILTNQENTLAPENLVDFIFNALPANHDSDEYLFERRFTMLFKPLLDIFNINSETEDQANKEVVQQIINLISKADGFSWIYHKFQVLKNSCSFVYYCNCREELKSKKARVTNISSQRDTMPRIIRYDCGGTIQINIERTHNLVVVNIYYYLHPPPEAIEVSQQIRNYIFNNNLLTVPQLYNNIKNEKINGFLNVTRKQIYYWFKKIATEEYRLADDQLESARRYLENNLNFKLLYQDQHSIAFLTPLLFVMPNKVTKTIVVDSTYGTNRLKFELFAVLGIID
ncbi:770_t:CDS:1, partial [Scutellospora calospora]